MDIRGAALVLLSGMAMAPAGYSADAARAGVDFLAREVPRWQPENHCFSCHNNGDAARALLLAKTRGRAVPPGALDATIEWLRKPEAWDEAQGNPGFSDRKLARVQFSAALAEAVRDGLSAARPDLTRAAESLAALQESTGTWKGSWKIDTGGVAGAPATYGAVLATCMARQTLETADAKRFGAAIASANGWLRGIAPANLLDRAAVLLALPDTAVVNLPPLLDAQNSDGGWGPQPHAPSEAFDTAVVLLALNGVERGKRDAAIARGREFLVKFQLNDGSWPETTRPSGFISYAERISTAGWATYALLTIDPERH